MFIKKENYNLWEYSYYPHLVNIYKIFYKTDKIDCASMFTFFKFIYANSSGYISPYLEKMNKTREKQYQEYIIKRNNL